MHAMPMGVVRETRVVFVRSRFDDTQSAINDLLAPDEIDAWAEATSSKLDGLATFENGVKPDPLEDENAVSFDGSLERCVHWVTGASRIFFIFCNCHQ